LRLLAVQPIMNPIFYRWIPCRRLDPGASRSSHLGTMAVPDQPPSHGECGDRQSQWALVLFAKAQGCGDLPPNSMQLIQDDAGRRRPNAYLRCRCHHMRHGPTRFAATVLDGRFDGDRQLGDGERRILGQRHEDGVRVVWHEQPVIPDDHRWPQRVGFLGQCIRGPDGQDDLSGAQNPWVVVSRHRSPGCQPLRRRHALRRGLRPGRRSRHWPSRCVLAEPPGRPWWLHRGGVSPARYPGPVPKPRTLRAHRRLAGWRSERP
jgi:hypothetical protein